MSGYSTRRIVDLEDKVRAMETELRRLRQMRKDLPEILKRDPELPGRLMVSQGVLDALLRAADGVVA